MRARQRGFLEAVRGALLSILLVGLAIGFLSAPLAALVLDRTPVPDELSWGVNLTGLAFGDAEMRSGGSHGKYGQHYIGLTGAELDYFEAEGMTVFRLPFRWERVQHSLYEELDPEDMGYMDAVVDAAAERGLKVILDPHQRFAVKGSGTGYYDLASDQILTLGSPELPYSAFADFWLRLASHYSDHPGVYGYGLINEPHGMDIGGLSGSENWKQAAQAAIHAIRAVDGQTTIIVPGYHWSNAYEWDVYSDNLKDLYDPAGNMIYEAHIYLDKSGSGSYDEDCETVAPDRGPQRLDDFVNWLRANGKKGIIGELGTPADQCWLGILEPTLDYISASDDVLVSFQWWRADRWWISDPLSMQPNVDSEGNYIDRPQMDLLKQHIK